MEQSKKIADQMHKLRASKSGPGMSAVPCSPKRSTTKFRRRKVGNSATTTITGFPTANKLFAITPAPTNRPIAIISSVSSKSASRTCTRTKSCSTTSCSSPSPIPAATHAVLRPFTNTCAKNIPRRKLSSAVSVCRMSIGLSPTNGTRPISPINWPSSTTLSCRNGCASAANPSPIMPPTFRTTSKASTLTSASS